MRGRTVSVLVGALTVVALTGCASDGGPLLSGWSEGSACTGADDRSTYVATQYIDNRAGSSVTLTAVEPAEYVNTSAKQVLIGPEVSTLIVGGAEGARNLDRLHPFAAYELAPEQTATVAFVGTVQDHDLDAAVHGVRVWYTLDGREYSGVIPWTYTFAHGTCR